MLKLEDIGVFVIFFISQCSTEWVGHVYNNSNNFKEPIEAGRFSSKEECEKFLLENYGQDDNGIQVFECIKD